MGLFNTGSTLSSVIQDLISFINLVVEVLAPLALVVFFYGLARYVYKSDDEHEREHGREVILWSLIAIFVLFSVWGILALMGVAFFGGYIGAPGSTFTPSYGTF